MFTEHLKQIREFASSFAALSGLITAIVLLNNGSFDPLYISAALIVVLICGVVFAILSLRRPGKLKPETPSSLELPPELVESRAREHSAKVARQNVSIAVPMAFACLASIGVLIYYFSYIIRPLDSIDPNTIGGFVAYGATDSRPFWYFPCGSVSDPSDTSQAALQHVYTDGHGIAFQLLKRPSAEKVLVRKFTVKITSLEPLPEIHIPPGGAEIILPYVLVAEIPSGAEVGSEWPATYYKRDEKTNRLEAVDAGFMLEDRLEFFQVRVSSETEGAIKFKVLADVDSGWRSRRVEIGESEVCLFLKQDAYRRATETPRPENFDQVYDWLLHHERLGRRNVTRSWEDSEFGLQGWKPVESGAID